MAKHPKREHWTLLDMEHPLPRPGVYALKGMDGRIWIKFLGSFYLETNDPTEWDRQLQKATQGRKYRNRELVICPNWEPSTWFFA